MKSILTTILDFVAVTAVVIGAFMISAGLGFIASGFAVAVVSLLIERLNPDRPEDRRGS